MLTHDRVLVEAMAAGIEPLEFRRQMRKKRVSISQFLILTHCSTLLPSSYGTKLELRPTMLNVSKRQSGVTLGRWRCGTKPQEDAADELDCRESAKAAGVIAERNCRYDNNECYMCGKQGHKQRDCPGIQKGQAGKAFMAGATARPPYSSSSSQVVPLSIPGARPRRWPLRPPPLELVRARPLKIAVVTEIKLTAPDLSTQNDDDNVYIRLPREFFFCASGKRARRDGATPGVPER